MLRELEEEYEEPDEDHIDRTYLIFPPAEYCALLASLAGDAHRQQIDHITSLEEQALSMMKSIFESQDVTVMTDAPFQLRYTFSSPFVTVQQYRSGEYILKQDDRCATKVWTHKDDPTMNTSWLSFSSAFLKWEKSHIKQDYIDTGDELVSGLCGLQVERSFHIKPIVLSLPRSFNIKQDSA